MKNDFDKKFDEVFNANVKMAKISAIVDIIALSWCASFVVWVILRIMLHYGII